MKTKGQTKGNSLKTTARAVVALCVGFISITAALADPIGNPGFETVFVNSSSTAPGFSPAGPVPPNTESASPGWTSTPEVNVTPWQTSASDNLIEIWESGFLGVNASTGSGLLNGGNHFAELNANEVSTLFQDVNITDQGTVGFFFLHRGRNGTESLRLTITFNPSVTINPGVTNVVRFTGDFSAGTAAWVSQANAAAFTIGSGQTGTYRFAYESLETALPKEGNFLDNAAFGVGVVPEPATTTLALAGVAFVFLRFRRRLRNA